MSDNVRHLLHLIWSSRNKDTPIAARSLNTEKAFNRVEWAFLIQCTLKIFGFGEGFIKWVKVIYSSLKAFVLTDGLMSPLFNLLFVIFLEPLAAAIRADTGIMGVWGGGCEHK